MTVRKRRGRKLLVASIGVAAVSYVACGGNTENRGTPQKDAQADAHHGYDAVANLVAPPDANGMDVVANLVAPTDAGADAPEDHGSVLDVVANLVPPPLDGGKG